MRKDNTRSIDCFLKVTDLDDLLNARSDLKSLSPDDREKIKSVLDNWDDEQAVSNLLFYPDIIPEECRLEAIDKALHSFNKPYYSLAAIVGLQNIRPTEFPETKQIEWKDILLEMIQSESDVIAERASVTIRQWLPDSSVAELLHLYPSQNNTVSKNILSFALIKYGDLTEKEYLQKVSSFGFPPEITNAFMAYYEEYDGKKRDGHWGAEMMKLPLLAYIPNLTETYVEAETPSRPWWKFW